MTLRLPRWFTLTTRASGSRRCPRTAEHGRNYAYWSDGHSLTLPGVVVPLARLQPALDVNELALGEELAADLGQPVPGYLFSCAELSGRARDACTICLWPVVMNMPG
jgi:hypothetical protein